MVLFLFGGQVVQGFSRGFLPLQAVAALGEKHIPHHFLGSLGFSFGQGLIVCFIQGICGLEEESLVGCIFLGGWFFWALMIIFLICCGFISLGWAGCPGIFPRISPLTGRSCPWRQTHTPSFSRIPLILPLDRYELCVLSKEDPLSSPWLAWGLKRFLSFFRGNVENPLLR